MNKVYLDTNVVIYLIDSRNPFHQAVRAIFDSYEPSQPVYTGSILLKMEFLAKPLLAVTNSLAFNSFAQALELDLIPINEVIIEGAVTLIAQNTHLKLADAIHLATAQAAGCTHFFTNDKRLPAVEGLKMVWVE